MLPEASVSASVDSSPLAGSASVDSSFATVSPFAEVLGSPVVVSPLSLSFLQAAKAKTKQRARTRAMIFFVISVTSEYEIFIQSRFFAVFSPERMSTKNQSTACAVVFIIK